MKITKVLPVFKKSDKNLSHSYRSVSIILILRKIIESYITHQLYDYFDCSRFLYNHLYGFRPGHSTTMVVETINCRQGYEWFKK